MKKLTKQNIMGRYVLASPTVCGWCGETDWSPMTEDGEEIANRLAAYEDSGKTPEEVKEELENEEAQPMDYDTTTFHYKGYAAQVRYSEEDQSYIGVVIGISDSLAFDCDTLSEAEDQFHALIDDYLEMKNRVFGKKGSNKGNRLVEDSSK